MPTLQQVVSFLDDRYDPRWAQPWDAVGLVCGDPGAPVRRVLLAVDPVAAVVDDALAWGADLLLTHHPLLLRPVHGVAATTPKGRLVHRLVRAGIGLHVIHTNADAADPGVSDALALVLGLVDLDPLEPAAGDSLDKVVTFVPHPQASAVTDALAAAGAGSLGAYERCAWTTTGTGTFLPTAGATPAIGSVGRVEEVPETRVEMVLPRHRRAAVVAALRAAHPYEEPAFDLLELASVPGSRGLGRVGRLARPEPLAAFVGRVAAALPATAAGVRASGDPDRVVERVAVCGGSGDSLLAAARAAGVDAYVTADLRHHPASEAVEEPDAPALVDVAHWASEWPWLVDAAAKLQEGTTVDTRVCERRTDPWTLHTPSEGSIR